MMTEEQKTEFLSSRREILFLYDIRMGNPNGDPDENRPRRLPDGRFYVTDVRLKRFARDYIIATQGEDKILVGNIEGRTTNLTGRVGHYLEKNNEPKATGQELVNIILSAFTDARWFGSSLAFKKHDDWKPEPQPKTLTGAVQFNMGEVLHDAEEIQIQGTSVFASDEEKTQGTFTNYAALRYGLIAFHGVANEHSAKKSRMTDSDYDELLKALWNGVRSCGNTRTKVGQVPRLLISVEYKTGQEFQFGNLMDYVKTEAPDGKPEKEWASPVDYEMDIRDLLKRLEKQAKRIEKIRYEVSPDIVFKEKSNIPESWQDIGFDSTDSK
jgi:CRISPR-associated protein Csh2